MDTSKEYIKMCEKAEEIQELWKSKVKGDLFIDKSYIDSKNLVLKDFIMIFMWDLEPEREYVWLPTQSQLQEMINQDYLSEVLRFTSMEQLWLAFVMKEKFGKTWDGSDWKSGL